MLTALYDQFIINPCMRLSDMATFLRKEFDVDATRFSIRRVLKDHKWSKKVTQNIVQERNLDMQDEYMHEISSLRSDQPVFIDETRLDKGIRIRRTGWAPRGKRPRQIKRFHRGRRFQILLRVYEGSTDTRIRSSSRMTSSHTPDNPKHNL